MKNKIKIIVPFHNPGNYLDRCVNSLLTQDYDNYEILFIDDSSTDGSFAKIPSVKYKTNEDGEFLKDDNGDPIIDKMHPLLSKTKCLNINAWRSGERVTALPNIHNGIMQFANEPDDIVIIVDGDDFLFNRTVLSDINDFYVQNNECWLMYGSSKITNGHPCYASKYSEEEFENIRRAPFRVSHIRTFRAGLYHQIEKQDPTYSCMKNVDGNWYTVSYDACIIFPMLEMAGYEHVFYNENPFYVYNVDNPISDDRLNMQLKMDVKREIIQKEKFNKIQNYK
jgi:glycosyltransferase involved in cell wall biosynthesis